jgi:hypothetical protein
VFALVGVVTLLVGWVEDRAARRTPELVPGGPRRAAAADAPASPAPAGAGGEPVAAGARVPAPRAPGRPDRVPG